VRASGIALLLFAGAVSCNFDAAFGRYCADNPSCPRADAGVGPETAPDIPPDTTAIPDTSTAAPEVGGREGGSDQSFPPPPPKICTSRDSCGAGEICHPFGNVCMKTCNTVDDCPPYLDACAEITDRNGGVVGAPKVCKCTNTPNCNNYGTNFTCNSLDNLCEHICNGQQDCSRFEPARTCDQNDGQCLNTCYGNRDCPSATQPRCDPSTSRCAGCTSDYDCGNRPDGLTRCDASGACVRPSP
jgi:hypothetical protein